VNTVNDNVLILASASPRRRELLTCVYPHFVVEPCTLEEPAPHAVHVDPADWAIALAYFKARAVADRYPGRWVLGADTLVVCAGQVLGKPTDEADARRMLELQAQHPGEVITGVCLLRGGSGARRLVRAERTRVWMRDDVEIREAYLRTGDWAGKAGAYGIQTVGDRLVTRIEGSFSNVVGLPLVTVAELLREAGLPVDPPPAELDWQPASEPTDPNTCPTA